MSISEEASEAAAGQPAADQSAIDQSRGQGKQLLDAVAVERALTRISHEIVERNEGTAPLVLVGLQTGGVPFAEAIARRLGEIDPGRLGPTGTLDAAMHRDDIGLRPVRSEAGTHMPGEIDGATVVLVDDVVFTGRTVRAALDALGHYGRPAAVQLAVMVDRGHRELPIRADYVGKNLPTSRDERVEATLDGVWLQKAGA